MNNLQYIQENFITNTILKWRLEQMMELFRRGDFSCHFPNPIAVKQWIKNCIGNITPKKIEIMRHYSPELIKYVA